VTSTTTTTTAQGGDAAELGRPAELQRLIATRRVLVLLGAGGVGKTTSAIALALAAAQAGRRVALLSIDPARRLAAALGIELSGTLKRLALPADVTGSVHAAMLDQKAVFDAMVRKHAPSADVAAKILAHPVYLAVSSSLSGPLEYMALAKLRELAEDPAYDLVVLDTPPDTHALDFLARPDVLANFADNRVMSWLVKPFALAGRFGLAKVLGASERLMGGVAKITGMSTLHSLAEFLMLVQEVIDGFHRASEQVLAVLRGKDTAFVLVTIPTRAAARAAANVAREVVVLGYGVELLLVNRCLAAPVAEEALTAAKRLGDALPSGVALLAKRATGERIVISELARLLAHGRAPLIARRVDEESADLDDLAALLAFARRVVGAGEGPA
jgi:anion-transporting  ArsA/GET3 family ATPase